LSRLRSTRLGTVSLTALLLLVTPALVAVDSAAAAAVLKTHAHEGTAGSTPTAAAEGYSSRSGTAVTYTGTPAAADGATSLRFAGSAATYFEDAGLSSSTGKLVWSAPVLVPSLPPSGSTDRFLAARSSSGALGSVEIAPSGRLQLRNGGGTLRATGTFSLAAGTWYRAEALFQADRLTVRAFDPAGALVGTVGPVAITAGTPSRLRAGLLVAGAPLLIDRVQIADDWITDVAPPPPPPSPSPCGSLSGSYDPANPPQYDHVVVLMEENWSYHDFAASTQAPYLSSLNAGCGSETNFHAATHPSQPNYMAATSGVASRVGVKTNADNVFHQVAGAGLTWKAYQESMATPCQGTSGTRYKPGHNPAYYYNDLRTPTDTCATHDVPMSPALDDDISGDTLPAYSWISPDECHDFYWISACPTPKSQLTAEGDRWLAAMLPRLTAMPSYLAGRTLILVTFDEGREGTNENYIDCTDPAYYPAHPDCQIPTVVVSPYLAPGTTDGTDLNLYSLLGTTEDILGLPRLGRAVGQRSMRATMPF